MFCLLFIPVLLLVHFAYLLFHTKSGEEEKKKQHKKKVTNKNCKLEEHKKGGGEIEIKRIENFTDRHVTFCKRRNGLINKAYELSVLFDAEVALVVFSERNRLFEYANRSVGTTIERYKKAITNNFGAGSVAEHNDQYYQEEAAKLRRTLDFLEYVSRTWMGETCSTMTIRDMKQLEARLDKSIQRIRSKKNELLHAEIEYMQKRGMDLQNDNMYLRAKIAEKEQHMNTVPSTEHEVVPPQNFLQVI